MTILLDSASVEDAAAAARLGYVGGFTTNPLLMARETGEPLARFVRLLQAFTRGPAFYQPAGPSPEAMAAEARAAADLEPGRVVVKLPATADGAGLAAALAGEGVRCALTAAYAPAQALLAHETGCAWVIPYVDRATRQGIDGLALVETFASTLALLQSTTRVLAASLKSPDQLVGAVLRGSRDVTAPLDVLLALAEHPLSQAAAREFAAAASASSDASPAEG